MSIYKAKGKKDGKQKYRVCVSYIDRMGKKRQLSRTVAGMAEANATEAKLKAEVRQNTSLVCNLTLQELCDDYLEEKKYRVRESTYEKTKRNLDFYVISRIGNIKVKNLNLPLMQKWKMSINKMGLKNRTKQNAYAEFRALINYAVKMEYIPSNPLTKLGNFVDANEMPEEMKYYTVEEFHKFIAAARKNAENAQAENNLYEWNYYIFFVIAFFTGMRKGEIYGLRWTDIDGEYISVKRSIGQKVKGADRVTPPKNKSSIRTIQMPKPLITALNEHLERCKSIDGFYMEQYICGGARVLRDSSVQNRNLLFSSQAGVKSIRIHDFRHSHASLLANEGINIQEIARRLGHSNIEITWAVYSHLYPREEERAIAVLNNV